MKLLVYPTLRNIKDLNFLSRKIHKLDSFNNVFPLKFISKRGLLSNSSSKLITFLSCSFQTQRIPVRTVMRAANQIGKAGKVLADNGTHLVKSPSPVSPPISPPVRNISYSSGDYRSAVLPSSSQISTPQGEYTFHPGIALVSCPKPDCKTTNCADPAKSSPNPCGVSVQDHQAGNIPSSSSTGVPITVEVVANLTSNASPNGIPVSNVVPLTKGINATGQAKDQYAVIEKKVIPVKTMPPSQTKTSIYVQQNSVTNTLAAHIPKDSNINKPTNNGTP